MTENGGSTVLVAGRYRLERRIGRGGAGAVWRAHDERLDRPVAVKQILIAPDAEASSRTRALREARAAARLRVPTVVQVYDVIEEAGSAYLIMELVDAPNLSALVRRSGPLEPSNAAAVGLQILDALEAAHRVGIVHRDVKPSNVLLDNDMPRLTDFGIARLSDDPGLTSTGVVMGTPAYIAPEHARGAAVGPAIDLYGLGATLYYAVEGESPFSADGSLSTVMAVVNSPPRPMERAGPLADLITDLLAKDPADRPAPDEIRERLRAVADGVPRRPGITGAAPWLGATTARTETDDTDEHRVGDEATHDDEPEPAEHTEDLPVAAGADGGAPRRQRRRTALYAITAALLVMAAISLTNLLRDGDQAADNPSVEATEGAAAAGPTEDGGAAAGGAEPTPDASPEPSPEPPPEEEAGDDGDGVLPATDAEVPEDWPEFAPDDAPYRLRHPPGWDIVRVDGTRTDIRDPDSGTYLRLDWVDERRDPVGAWEELAPSFAASREAYEEIQITETTYKGDRAALWEYRYRDGGADLHAYNLGVNAGDAGFALNLQSREADWDEAQELWPLLLSGYEFTGP